MNNFCSLFFVHVVQVTIVALFVWAAVRIAGKNRPHLAHALWIIVLLKCITPPIFSSWASPFSWYNTAGQTAAAIQKTPPSTPKTVSIFRPNDLKTAPVVFDTQTTQQDFQHLEPPTAVSMPATAPSNFSWQEFFQFVVTACVAIGLLLFSIQIVRLVTFWRRVKGYPTAEPVRAQRLIDEVRARLGIRRQVRAMVVCGPIGPAVVGLFRPTILLPKSILDSNNDNSLSLMIAHEVIHIRRGDLWWALLQSLSGSMFWFHPIVRFAVRAASNECERSCDEETVASMGCQPADYANVLLDIIEEKQLLRFSSVLPGIKPVEITSSRLERIMKLRHGSHKRTPWWAWAVLAAGCLTALPGGSFAIGQSDQPLVTLPLATDADETIEPSVSETDVDLDWVETVEYDVKDILDRLRKENPQAEKQEIELHLLKWIKGVTSPSRRSSKQQMGQRSIKITNSKLIATLTPAIQQRLRRQIASYKKHGVCELLFEVRVADDQHPIWEKFTWNPVAKSKFISGHGALQQNKPMAKEQVTSGFLNKKTKTPSQWNTKLNAADILGPALNANGFQLVGKTTNVQAIQAITLQDTQIRTLLTTEIQQLPTAQTSSARPSKISNFTLRPFVTGATALEAEGGAASLQPIITALVDGFEMTISPSMLDRSDIQLAIQFSESRIHGVERKTIDSSKNWSVQVPQVSARQIELVTTIRDANTLAFKVPSISKKQPGQVYLLTPRIVVPPVQSINGQRTIKALPKQTDVPSEPTFREMVVSSKGLDDKIRRACWQCGVEVTQADMEKFVKTRAATFGMTSKQFIEFWIKTSDTVYQKPGPVFPPTSEVRPSKPAFWSAIKREVSIDMLPPKFRKEFVGKVRPLFPNAIVLRSQSNEPKSQNIGSAKTIEINDQAFIILADVNISPAVDGARISGKQLAVENAQGHEIAAADDVAVVMIEKGVNFELKGRSRLSIDSEARLRADYIRFKEPELELSMRGNAKLSFDGFEGSADEISLVDDGKVIKFSGDAKVKISGLEKPDHEGANIEWNLESGICTVDGVESGEFVPSVEGQTLPSTYYLDDDIQYLPKASDAANKN